MIYVSFHCKKETEARKRKNKPEWKYTWYAFAWSDSSNFCNEAWVKTVK